MKTREEILATWEDEGIYTEWYAIDSYEPVDGTIHRQFVGDYDTAWEKMTSTYARPTEFADQPFHRCSLISSDAARAFFEGKVGQLPDERGYYTATEAAEMLGLSRMRVNQLLNSHQLDGYKLDGAWRVYRYSVQNRLDETGK